MLPCDFASRYMFLFTYSNNPIFLPRNPPMDNLRSKFIYSFYIFEYLIR